MDTIGSLHIIQALTADYYFTGVQLINHNNIVAIGDSGRIIRTYDGGSSWEDQSLHITGRLSRVHFSDSLNGIVTAQVYDGTPSIFTTSNAGKNWNPVQAPTGGAFTSCHCSGAGRYKVFFYSQGLVYSTADNWNTFETENPAIASDVERTHYTFQSCTFGTGDGDTILAEGYYNPNPDSNFVFGAICRSLDGGKTWENPVRWLDGSQLTVYCASDPDRDTVIAGGIIVNKHFLVSTNHGQTWQVDTLQVDSASDNVNVFNAEWTNHGPIIQLSTSKIIKSPPKQLSVESDDGKLYFNYRVYPIPTTEKINIVSVETPQKFHIYDVVGREMLMGMTLDHATLQISIANWPAGVYFAFVDNHGVPISIGKIILVR